MGFFKRTPEELAASRRKCDVTEAWAAAANTLSGTFCGGVRVDRKADTIVGPTGQRVPILGAEVEVVAEGEERSRITATRLVATGALALIWKKKTSARDVALLVSHPDAEPFAVGVRAKHEKEARKFARAINCASKGPEHYLNKPDHSACWAFDC